MNTSHAHISELDREDLTRELARARARIAELEDIQAAECGDENALYRLFREKELYRRNLETVFRSIPDGIVTVDRSMRVLQANQAFLDMCAAQGVATGAALTDIDCPGVRACVKALSEVLASGRGAAGLHVTCPGPDGVIRTLSLTTAPLLDSEGNHSGALLMSRDLTRETELARRLHERHNFHGLVGKSPAMQKIYDLIENLAGVDSMVLITGESGTGKEMVAEALHHHGPRAQAPLVKVNCAALAENLLESELFGHVRGAFTGATRDKQGRFEAARGGSLLLDEIGDLPGRLQLKLLRVLDSREFERVGENRTRRIQARIMAATNVDLTERVAQGLFREDLYYRLRVMGLDIPPLRQRPEDIPLLVAHFARDFALAFGKTLDFTGEEVAAALMHHPWPGNVRELKNAVEHAFLLCPGGMVEPSHLPVEVRGSRGAPSDQPLSQQELLLALEQAGGNKSKAARILGVHRTTIHRRLKSLDH
jgi:transcriptional regulator with PAS, ATPase and Fis domain